MSGKKQRGTKQTFDEGERGEWKSWLKTKIMAFSPWQIDREKMEQWQTLFSDIPKSLYMGMKPWYLRHLFLGRKVMTNLDSILKRRDITLLAKVRLIKGMVFPIVTYGCQSWTINKAEHRRIDAFELWCWRRLLRVPWTARRSNQSIQRKISPEYSLDCNSNCWTLNL